VRVLIFVKYFERAKKLPANELAQSQYFGARRLEVGNL